MLRFILFCWVLFFSFGVCGEEGVLYPSIRFPVGERIEFRLKWGVFSVAKTVVTTEFVEEEGRRYVAIRARTKSNGYLKKIYPVDDFIESLVDVETGLPVRFTKVLNEGRHHRDEVTLFDHVEGVALWRSRKRGEVKEYAIEEDTRDILSFMYHTRSRLYEPNTVVTNRMMSDEKLYDVMLNVKGRERVRLKKYGKVDSMAIVPRAMTNGLFVQKGQMYLWVSNDERNIITKMVVDLPFANVKLFLYKVFGGPDDVWNLAKP